MWKKFWELGSAVYFWEYINRIFFAVFPAPPLHLHNLLFSVTVFLLSA
jgi:hypothetical protein